MNELLMEKGISYFDFPPAQTELGKMARKEMKILLNQGFSPFKAAAIISEDLGRAKEIVEDLVDSKVNAETARDLIIWALGDNDLGLRKCGIFEDENAKLPLIFALIEMLEEPMKVKMAC